MESGERRPRTASKPREHRAIVETIKQIPGRLFIEDQKAWSIPFGQYNNLIELYAINNIKSSLETDEGFTLKGSEEKLALFGDILVNKRVKWSQWGQFTKICQLNAVKEMQI
jgi:hypothetical protein